MGIFMQKPSTVQPCSQDFGPWVAKPPDERSESIASEAHEACRALGRRTAGVWWLTNQPSGVQGPLPESLKFPPSPAFDERSEPGTQSMPRARSADSGRHSGHGGDHGEPDAATTSECGRGSGAETPENF